MTVSVIVNDMRNLMWDGVLINTETVDAASNNFVIFQQTVSAAEAGSEAGFRAENLSKNGLRILFYWKPQVAAIPLLVRYLREHPHSKSQSIFVSC